MFISYIQPVRYKNLVILVTFREPYSNFIRYVYIFHFKGTLAFGSVYVSITALCDINTLYTDDTDYGMFVNGKDEVCTYAGMLAIVMSPVTYVTEDHGSNFPPGRKFWKISAKLNGLTSTLFFMVTT